MPASPRLLVAWSVLLTAAASLQAAPAISTFTPATGVTGTQVTLTGSGFTGATRVEFGQGAGDFVVLSPTSIRATVPPDATLGPIRVTAAGTSGSSAAQFLPAPRIEAVSPNRAAANSQISVTGQNFSSVQSVQFGSLPAAYSVTGVGALLATVPFGASNAPITIVTSAGRASSPLPFVVTSTLPIVDSIDPELGPPGTTVRIQGLNFNNVTAVKFGTNHATSFTVPTAGDINAVVPNINTNAPVTVFTLAGSNISSQSFLATWNPILTNFSPTIGKVGTDVVFTGVNISNLTSVRFGGVAATTFGSGPLQGQWHAIVPANATSGPVTITTQIGGVSRTNHSSTPFTVTSAPVITSFEPADGRPGTPITVLGANLSNGPTVLYIGSNVARFTKLQSNPDYVVAYAPTNGTSGPLTLSNQFGSFTTPNAFSLIGQKPFLTGITPASGPRGTTVQLTGYNFSNPVTVRFGGSAAPETTASSTSGMSVTVPADATTGLVTLTTPNGTTTNLLTFQVPPRMASISPISGFVGQHISVLGLSLTNTLAADVADTGASFTYVSDTNVLVLVPTNAESGRVRLRTAAGEVLSYESFTVLPHITRFDPPLGPSLSTITLYGTSLTNASSVTFNTRPATFTVVSSTEVRTVVPANATTGPIKITTPTGSFTTSSNFTVTTSSDLHLAMDASSPQVQPGETLDFALSLTNRGTSPLTRIQLTNTLPAGLSLVDVSASQGSWSNSGPSIVVSLGTLYTNASAHLTVRTLANTEGLWTNRAVVAAAEGDWNVGDNRAEAHTLVLANANRTLGTLLSTNSNLVLTWPISAVPLQLQFATELPPTNGWQNVPTAPAAISGWYRLTNPVAGSHLFYRLVLP